MRRVLWWLIGGTRGGRNRLRIVLALDDRPMNTNQLSNELDLDYKTVQHHLELLSENGVLTTMGEDYGKVYFLTENMEANMDVLTEVAEQAGLDDAFPGEGHRRDQDDGDPDRDDDRPGPEGDPT